MPRYSPTKSNTTKPYVDPNFQIYLGKKGLRVMKTLTKEFSDDSMFGFYTPLLNASVPLCSPLEAKARAFSLTMKTEVKLFNYVQDSDKFASRRSAALKHLMVNDIGPMPFLASNTEVRLRFNYAVIDQLHSLRLKKLEDSLDHFYLGTFSCYSWFSSEYNPFIDIERAKRTVTDLVRNHADCNALGIFEIQPISNCPQAKEGDHMLMLHCHVIMWRPSWKRRAVAKFRARCDARMANPLLKETFHRIRIKDGIDDMLRIGSYLPKLPYSYKRYDPIKGLVDSEKPLSIERLLRLREILARIPNKSFYFAIGDEGRALKRAVFDHVQIWRKSRVSTIVHGAVTQSGLEVAFSEIWAEVNDLYSSPPIVRLRRHD